MSYSTLFTCNPSWGKIEDIPSSTEELFWSNIVENVTNHNFRVLSLFATPMNNALHLVCILGNDTTSLLKISRFELINNTFQSHASIIPQIHLFEREIAEQFGVTVHDHPWLKPVRFEQDFSLHVKKNACGDLNYFQVSGEDVHEVAVGPVHAGVIEPGHFRFQCYGENVVNLEISLGYQHRGIERMLQGGPSPQTLSQMEVLAGDTTIGHSLAYVQLVEAMAGIHVSQKSELIRIVLLELERIANHVGDIGALSGDTGFLPTASYCGKLRGDFLNLTASITGNRFGRGGIIVGGVGYDIDFNLAATIAKQLKVLQSKTLSAIDLFFRSTSVLERVENIGKITKEDVITYGFVGIAAKACAIARDTRKNYPFGYYNAISYDIPLEASCDIFARAMMRRAEIVSSLELIHNMLRSIQEIAIQKPTRVNDVVLPSNALGISLTEGWRGEIVHVAQTDEHGKLVRYKITDPSFHNWTALSLAMREGQISDFPLCNKSFNLSYCGFDL
ncbi:NADH-quinone oxidoreductase subunit C [Sulfurospirillum oryzae]|uniref:NADH-quinone oxidoreductase subunit D-related protein n=1 Tax=Sulfurospirillum oryzae TaxID=2976535 RepID=UPI0021E76ED5|nr:NADH-quinone oxidoreductase subunit C [Sulfurospirillum oryzae]